MAGVRFTTISPLTATGGGTKTHLQLLAATNQRVLLKRVRIGLQGVVATDAPIQFELLRQTSAGTASSGTLRKINSSDSETLQSSSQHTVTAEPTAGDILDTWLLHPQTREHDVRMYAEPIVVPGGSRIAVRSVTPGVSVNCIVVMEGEE